MLLSHKDYNLFYKSLLGAFLIHAVFFYIFKLTVTLREPYDNPTFIFLGAILKPQDLLMPINKNKKTSIANSSPLPASFIKNPNVSISDKTVQKPLFSKMIIDKKNKIVLKPTFSQEESSETDKNELLKKTGIQKTYIYQPLSLH